MSTLDALCILETALLCADEPLTVSDLCLLFDSQISKNDMPTLLRQLAEQWSDKGLELVEVRTGWRFQSRHNVLPYLERLKVERPPRYSRATLEVLAIIAYRQPVTRGDIEDIRGVAVSTQIIRQLEDRGWVEVIGHRETPGRPSLYATTAHFLDDLGLATLGDLPQLESDALAQSSDMTVLMEKSQTAWFSEDAQEQRNVNKVLAEELQKVDSSKVEKNILFHTNEEENDE